MKIGINIIDFFKNKIPSLSSEGIYTYFGRDNNYPEKIDYLLKNSISGRRSVNLMTKFIIGKGVETINEKKVNENQSFFDFIRDIAEQITIYRGVYVAAEFNAAGQITQLKVPPFFSIRKTKKDDNGYNAKYIWKSNWLTQNSEKKEFWSWDIDPNVMLNRLKQKEKSGMIYFWNADQNKNEYPLSRFNEVMNDLDTERMISVFKNKTLNGGFFGKKIFLMPKLTDDNIDKTSPEYYELKEYENKVKDAIGKFMGVENIDNTLILSVNIDDIEQLEKSLIIKDIPSNIEPDLFLNVEKSIKENIMVAANNIPPLLFQTKDNSLFQQSGEAIRQAKIYYNEQTEAERQILENILLKVFEKFENPLIYETIKREGITELIKE